MMVGFALNATEKLRCFMTLSSLDMKTWEVTAELNMDASHYESIIVKANTERKARIIGEDAFNSRPDVFFITNLSVKEIKMLYY